MRLLGLLVGLLPKKQPRFFRCQKDLRLNMKRVRSSSSSVMTRHHQGFKRGKEGCCNGRMTHVASNNNNVEDSYKDAVRALNSLQTNAQTLAQADRERKPHRNITESRKYLQRSGMSLEQLDRLSVIHVSGTKGKGSTCAFCESVFLEHGCKTGLFTSPHLVAVRERIRINGQPLNKQAFTNYFWDVFHTLQNEKEHEKDMPAYFKFMTVLAFNVFWKEKVDVAIIEVGIGGQYDCTNIIRKPVAVGITSLGLDHVKLLGDTIEKIAWQKAGIMKPGVPAFTTASQPKEALQVLQERAAEIGCSLRVAPELESYMWGPYQTKLGVNSKVQLLNASLALQLCHAWMHRNEHLVSEQKGDSHVPVASSFEIGPEYALGLQLCQWPGRSQILVRDRVVYFLDGAHTTESVEAGVEWFEQSSKMMRRNMSGQIARALIFNSTGDRDSKSLLQPLISCAFDAVVFCTNNVDEVVTDTSAILDTISRTSNGLSAPLQNVLLDQANFTVTREHQLDRCIQQGRIWLDLLSEQDHRHTESQVTVIMPSTRAALRWLAGDSSQGVAERPTGLQNCSQLQVLVMGSLHLVGGVLAVIDPEVSCQNGRQEVPVAHMVKAYLKQCNEIELNRIPGAP